MNKTSFMSVNRTLVESGIRFGIATVLADSLGILVFGSGSVVLFCSFAVASLAFFCDFDGSASERFFSNVVATLIGLIGVVLGAFVAQHFSLAVLTTFLVGFGFTFARVFRGFIARSVVGVQLAFILAVVIPAQPSHLGAYVLSWVLGCAVTTVVMMCVFPRHHSGTVRMALSMWCRSVKRLAAAVVAGSGVDSAVGDVVQSMDHLSDLSLGIQEWPGSFSPQKRALNYMFVTAQSATASVQRFVDAPRSADEHASDLDTYTTSAFQLAADVVEPTVHVEVPDYEGIRQARSDDLLATEAWVSALLAKDPHEVVPALIRHHPIRVMSIVADVMQRLALMSKSIHVEEPGLGVAADQRPVSLIRGNLTMHSIWFRNGIRAGLGTAVAVFVEHHLGLAHGFWVVLATLAMINVTFTGDGARSFALKAAAGTALGVVVGALVLALHPSFWVFVVLVTLVAFAAKISTALGVILGQATFSLFIILNTSAVGWPPSIRTAEVRFVDVAIGLALAVVATLVVFPRGLRKFLATSASDAVLSVDELVESGIELLSSPNPDRERFTERRSNCLDQVQRFGGALDAVYHAASTKSPDLVSYTDDEAWMRQAIVVADVFDSFLAQEPGLVSSGELGEVFSLSSDEQMERLTALAVKNAPSFGENPRQLICTVWAALWVDHLSVHRPVPAVLGARTPWRRLKSR